VTRRILAVLPVLAPGSSAFAAHAHPAMVSLGCFAPADLNVHGQGRDAFRDSALPSRLTQRAGYPVRRLQ
jgi:hypothetical protein